VNSNDTIAWFADIGLDDRSSVGGKGGSLGELERAGIDVPPGFVVRTNVFERFIQALDARAPLRAAIETLDPDQLDAVSATTKAIRERVLKEPLPADIEAEVGSAYAALCADAPDAPVAVRSSATTEDAADASFAGLQDTYLWVIGADEVLKMVRSCWASLYSVESVCYRRRHDFREEDVAMAVVVQRMIDARTAGVMFTRSPTSGDRSVVTIEGAFGLGSSVVSGEVTPDRWVIAKLTDEITVRDVSDKHIKHAPKPGGGVEEVELSNEERRAPSLSDEELIRLKAIGQRTEKHYGRPQDIEWAIENGTGRIFLLQSRPETVWSAKDAAPVARPQSDPMKHVLNIFGGRR
jgi:pyruvate,water dikinase